MSCNSDLSSGKIEDIRLIGTTIEITQNPTDRKDNWMTVDLFDKDNKSIRNDSIKIIVNDIETSLQHRQGLYYNDESRYYAENVPLNNIYNFEIKLSDGKKYHLGSISALSEEKIGSIECDEQGNLNKNTVIRWKELKNINELTIYTSILLKTPNSNDKNYSSKDVIVKQINSTGEFTIPKSEYFDPKWTVSGFELKFTAKKFGKTNPKLIAGSKISISTVIEKNINLEKE
ncbi:hypothetical protein ASG22_01965 [Chryseobacterium sp. Leaf405]|uniref:hypothetical protein n=1 Tax=Chryseobacterium sp. Leaf405 TaxID=1736367 RepID=UPI0006FB123E|nr:hypothetical protein [Chryseobacterium sp. Leaf405]KQT35810.1 hypothetical protein ASG22_01965 [Chryseobacterium sp. Leaf405]